MINHTRKIVLYSALSALLILWPSKPIWAAEYGPNEVRHVTNSRNLDVINYIVCLDTQFGNTPRRLSISQALTQAESNCRGFAAILPNSQNEPNAADIRQSILQCGFGPGSSSPSAASPDADCGGSNKAVPARQKQSANQTAKFPINAGSWGGKVRNGPGTNFPQIGSLQEGAPVTLLENSNVLMNGYPWFKIRFNGNQVGYKWGGILCARGAPIPGIFETCR